MRAPSARNPFQEKSRVEIKREQKGGEVVILCRSDGRREKDRAIREKQEGKLRRDLERLKSRIEKGRLKRPEKIHQAVGRLKERYPRVARYYAIEPDVEGMTLTWREDADKKERAKKLDGSYVLKTDRQDLAADDIWRAYILLTRVEDAFRDIKSPLGERPIYHQLEHRVQTHIFLCVLAYHLLVAIEHYFFEQDIHTSWATVRDALRTHQVVTVVLPTESGAVLRIRQGTTPEPVHREIYETLQMPLQVIRPVKTWIRAGRS
ncbi:MAG: transposase [bacterium]|nr:transposase [bacterium]